LHTWALSGVQEARRLKRAMFRWALDTGRVVRAPEQRGRRAGPLLRGRHARADRLVLAKVRGLFGPDLQFALTGAAPIARDVLEFFDACGAQRYSSAHADGRKPIGQR
jgi:long-chain acyl-CoA synthetase